MEAPRIEREMVKPLLDTRFIKVFDLQYAPGKHYYDASRRREEDLVALKSGEEFRAMSADAATCFVIVEKSGDVPRLLLTYEYRYPTGQFLLSPPAGLMDPEDRLSENPVLITAEREIFEETGLKLKLKEREDSLLLDRLFTVSPLVFSTPGMTDECNGLVCAVAHLSDFSSLTQKGAEGTEVFNGFELLSKEEAMKVLTDGRDRYGNYYSAYTFMALLYFVSDLWKA